MSELRCRTNLPRTMRKRLAIALGLTGVVCFVLLVAWPGHSSPTVTGHFEGYRYTATTRLAVFTVTNHSSCLVEFMPPIKVRFSDGWRPGICIVHNALELRPDCSGEWVFEVPLHKARWQASCEVLLHTTRDRILMRLSDHRPLGWTLRWVQFPKSSFSSEWTT